MLATFCPEGKENERSCTVCNYKVVVKTSEGQTLLFSILNDQCLVETFEDPDDLVEDYQRNDYFTPYEGCVREKELNEFVVNDDNYNVLESLETILRSIRDSGVRVSDEVRKYFSILE